MTALGGSTTIVQFSKGNNSLSYILIRQYIVIECCKTKPVHSHLQ